MKLETPLCPYRYMFGRPGEGVHQYRILDIAVVDVALTVLAAWIITWFVDYSFWTVFIALFFLGIVVHKLFCVRTKIDRLVDDIFFDPFCRFLDVLDHAAHPSHA